MTNAHLSGQQPALGTNSIVVPSNVSPLPATPPAPPNWVAIVALILSLGTLLKTFVGDWRAVRAKRASKFEAEFGTPIRTGLRAFEKSLSTLRAFVLPSAKTVDELKAEVEKTRQTWLDGAYEVGRLLQEADDTGQLIDAGWSQRFNNRSEVAEENILLIGEDTTTVVSEVRDLAQKSQAEWAVAIAEVRTSLRSELKSYEQWWRRK